MSQHEVFTNYRGQVVVWKSGSVRVDGKKIPKSQRWFWTPEWQAGEAEADAQIAAGDVETYPDAASAIASLLKSGSE